MKNSIRFLLTLTGFAASIVITESFSGCAATPTSESTGEYVDDAAITTKVKALLTKEKFGNVIGVKVITTKGAVQLSGTVATEEQKAQAEKLAGSVAGVKSVTNSITLKPAQK